MFFDWVCFCRFDLLKIQNFILPVDLEIAILIYNKDKIKNSNQWL